MLDACEAALPVEIAVCAAAVADWRPAERHLQKLKKQIGREAPGLTMIENPDILRTLSQPGPMRPRLVIGFAAETENIEMNAQRKLTSKGCDWILANNVAAEQGTFGGDENRVLLFDGRGDPEIWPAMAKTAVAERLVSRMIEHLDPRRSTDKGA